MGARKTTRRRGARSGSSVADRTILRGEVDSMADVPSLLVRIINVLGTNVALRLLGADRAQVSRWTARIEPVNTEMGRRMGRMVDLDAVLTSILRVYHRDAAAKWLVGSEPLLGGAQPIDVLAMEGAAPVIRAIDGIATGAYA